MKIPFLWVSLGFSMGILAEKFWQCPVLWLGGGLFAGILILYFLRGRKVFLTGFLLVLGFAGALWVQFEAYAPANAVQNFIGPGRVTLRGRVVSLPEMKVRGKRTSVSLVLQARSIARRDGRYRKVRRVRGNVQVFLLQAGALPQVGDELRLYGELSAPRAVLNPGEFDYGSFLAQKNINALFQTIGKKSVHGVKVGSRYAPARIIAEIRRKLAQRMDDLYAPPEAAILKALVLGLRSDVAPDVRNQFMKTGTIHLLAISGMNITMIAGTFYLIFLFCGMGFRLTALTTALIVILYVGLAGAGIPIQRAGCGALLVLVAVLVGRPVHLLNSLCFAFFAILVWNPQSLWNVGFQLSFLCVLSLILILPIFARLGGWMLSLASSLAVLFGTFPVVLYYFNIFSPVSVLANIVAIPLCDAALFTGLFALLGHGVPLLNVVLIKISTWILRASLAWVQYLSMWRWGYWFLERPPLGKLALYYANVAMIIILHRRIFPGRRWIMAVLIGCWISLSASFFSGSREKDFQLTLFASGRNQIAYARFSNESHWLLNAGRSFPSDQGEWLIAPLLRSRGVQSLEGILFTDLFKKNTGGLRSILRDFPAEHLLYPAVFPYGSDEFFKILRRFGRKARSFRPDDEVSMGHENMKVIAVTEKGTALLVMSGPWRILLITGWDPGLFRELLLRYQDTDEIHAVYLPPSGKAIPRECQDWLDRAHPLLAVLPEPQWELEEFLAFRRIRSFDLKRTGALDFRKNGSRLELLSYLKGRLGVYSYF